MNLDNKQFYITTPIYYANGSPHIGHFLTTTVADVLARYYRKRLGEENVFFTTGLDCHGTTVEQSAIKQGYTLENIQDYVDNRQVEWVEAFDKTNISYNYFVNTTHPKHKEFAQDFIKKLVANDDVYKALYKGKYCNGCEKFLTLSDLNEEGLCPLHRPDQVVEIEEENYYFKLSKYANRLKELISTDVIEIVPENKRNEILARLDGGVDDISITRPKSKVAWGVEFPGDSEQTVYVWTEALINYLSSLLINDKEGLWGGAVHTLGKDINWFHNVIWPALLLSAGYPLYKASFVHGFLNVSGQKISKSLGNIITPGELVTKYGIDGARYVILSNFPYKDDSDVTWELLDQKYNGDLANGIGNTFARVTKLAENSGLEFEISKANKDIWEKDWAVPFQAFRVDVVLQNIFLKASELDKHITEHAPWTITDKTALKEVLTCEIETLREIAVILEPFLPNTSEKMLQVLESTNIKGGTILFPRI